MKKKTLIISLVLTLTLVCGAFQTAFAGYNGFETRNEINEYSTEGAAEVFCINFYNEVKAGGYDLYDTEIVKQFADNPGSAVIVDAMPAGSYATRHLPGAINAVAPMKEEEFTAEEKAALLDAVDNAAGTKRVPQYYNEKTKKWQNTKPAKKYFKKKKTRTKIKNNGNVDIIVYCGWTGCARSHVAAKYLVDQGYKAVYRYPGGISAWKDAGYAMDPTSLDPEKDYNPVPTK